MTYTNMLLDRVKNKLSLKSDYQLSKLLGVSTSRIGNYRSERSVLDWELAFKIADLLEEDDQNVVYGLIDDKYKNPRLVNALQAIQHQ
ncbi:transcriptional regulator [Vibrio sp. SM6]|uniref:Transcriptional regulator n=1 Tax=Vibrio agarilyticus TaxID=2726741 RepID=A0A7X8TSC0_9VIBR|nr:transcriptional regulator [Vibrio agarilyticus]NLS13348.1 transcriptional regulator [Vibrio agarilyticus]